MWGEPINLIYIETPLTQVGMFRPSRLRKMHQGVTDPKYEGVRTSRKKLMENEEEDDSVDDTQDDAESHHEEDEEESGERRVQFDIPSEKESWKSNGAISGNDIPSESEDGSEASERGNRDITSNQNSPPKQSSENVGHTEDMSSALKKKREEDLQKGQAVKRQAVRPFGLRDSVCAG
jgi:protein AATF/BFR2